MSATAKPARIAISRPAMIHVPIFDLETRRKKESIEIPVEEEDWRAALGVSLAGIKARRLRPF
jgi:hypothetical protein